MYYYVGMSDKCDMWILRDGKLSQNAIERMVMPFDLRPRNNDIFDSRPNTTAMSVLYLIPSFQTCQN